MRSNRILRSIRTAIAFASTTSTTTISPSITTLPCLPTRWSAPHTGSGDQVIEGTRGNVDVQTGSGDVKLANLNGEIHLQTGSGNIRGREISGAVKGGTGSGDVEIEETGQGDIDMHTGSGNIKAHGMQGGFRGETGSGDVTAEGTQSGSWEIHTGSGNVHVRLPANAAFDADISTSSGTVNVGPAIEMTVQGRVGDSQSRFKERCAAEDHWCGCIRDREILISSKKTVVT